VNYDVIMLGATGVASTATLANVRVRAQRQRWKGRTRFELRFPPDVSPDAVAHVLVDLLRAPGPLWFFDGSDLIALEIVATESGVRHFITLRESRVEASRSALFAAIPGLRMELSDPDVAKTPTAASEIGTSSLDRPLRSDNPAATSRSILASLAPLRASESVRIQWIVAKAGSRRPIADPAPKGRTEQHVLAGLANEVRSREATAARRAKQSAPLFWGVARIGAVAADRSRAQQLVGRVFAAHSSVSAPGARLVRLPRSGSAVARRLFAQSVPSFSFPAVLNARELAAVIGWPLESPSLPGVVLALGRTMPPSPHLPSTGRPVGIATFPSMSRLVAIPFESTSQNQWIAGPTGSGKSVLMVNQILADIEAPDHRAVIAFDMKTDTIDAVLERFPSRRDGDLIVLDPTSDRPIGYNPLVGATRNPEVVADALFGILKRLWHLEAAPRTSDLLHVAMTSLTFHPGATLIDIGPLVTNRAFRTTVVSRLQAEPVLANYWTAFEAMSDGERAQVVAPLLTRARQLALRSNMRVVLGQELSTIDLGRILNEGKVLLIPVGVGQLGPESAALLAAIMLSGLWSAVQARSAMPIERRRPAVIFIDEWQIPAAGVTDMAQVLALCRGYNVGFALANQSPTQLSPALREAVAVNARSKLVFGTSAGDAATLAKEFGHGLSAADIQGLGRYEVMASIALANATAPPVTVLTQPLDPSTRDAGELRRLSAERYGRPRAEVEAELRARYATTPGVTNPGVRRRQP
jgi:hypothetical protein